MLNVKVDFEESVDCDGWTIDVQKEEVKVQRRTEEQKVTRRKGKRRNCAESAL